MALQVAMGADDTPTGASPPYTETYTHSLGVTPDLILFYCTRITTSSAHDTDGSETSCMQSFGISVGTATGDNAGIDTDLDATACGGSLWTSGGSVTGVNLGSGVVKGYVDQIGTTTFRVNYTAVHATTAYHLHWIAIAGITEASIVNSTSPTSVSTKDVAHGLSGGAPDAVICLGPNVQTGVSTNNKQFCIGAWDGTTHGTVGQSANWSGADYDYWAFRSTTNVLEKRLPSTGAVQVAAHVNSADGTNIEFDFTTVEGTARPFVVLSLRGVQFDLIGGAQKTGSTGTQDYTTAFTPEFVFLLSHSRTGVGAGGRGACCLGAGVSSTVHLHTCSTANNGDTGSDEAESICTGSKCQQMVTRGAGAALPSVNAEANLDATTPFPSNAFRLDWTTVDASARNFNAMAMAEAAAAQQTLLHYGIRLGGP